MKSKTLAAVAGTWPLLLGMGMLMLGAGLQGTLISVRATIEGFPTIVTGVVMSCYYVGYILGSVGTPRLVRRVGHIRVFAALTAISSVAILIQAVFVEPVTWAVLRVMSGFCFAGIYIVAESWLNDHASNESRGRLLAAYMLVLYVGLGAGQFLLTAADPLGPLLFIAISISISLAVVPITLSAQRVPQYDVPHSTGFRELFHLSPLGVIGVTVSGTVTGSLFSMGPAYAQMIGLDAADIAAFMGVSILAAVFTQLPIGRWSDRVDRRTVLIATCLVACVAALLASVFGRESRALLFVLAACFGGIALTLYSLALSHINDQLQPAQMVGASSSIVLLNGAGSALGPLVVAALMQAYGPSFYFGWLALVVGGLAAYGLYRKRVLPPVPPERKGPFVSAQPQSASGQMVAEIVLHAGPAPSDRGTD